MTEELCPHCGSLERRMQYNKWHVKEIYCAQCGHCLNQDEIRERTKLAEMASREGKLNEFWFGQYKPGEETENKE